MHGNCATLPHATLPHLTLILHLTVERPWSESFFSLRLFHWYRYGFSAEVKLHHYCQIRYSKTRLTQQLNPFRLWKNLNHSNHFCLILFWANLGFLKPILLDIASSLWWLISVVFHMGLVCCCDWLQCVLINDCSPRWQWSICGQWHVTSSMVCVETVARLSFLIVKCLPCSVFSSCLLW